MEKIARLNLGRGEVSLTTTHLHEFRHISLVTNHEPGETRVQEKFTGKSVLLAYTVQDYYFLHYPFFIG